MPEEQRPWATIIVREGLQPNLEFDIVPASSKPMWPTEE